MAPARRTELDDLVRGACGGLLFGVPLLYTMEVWWVGSLSGPVQLLMVLAGTFAVVLLVIRTGGFRSTGDVTLRQALADSVEAMAIGIVLVTLFLVLIREVDLSTPLREALGKIVYEAAPFSLGVSLAGQFLSKGKSRDGEDGSSGHASSGDSAINATLADVGATLLGATFVAFNIAPTDEVPLITAAMSPAWIVAAVGVSLVVSYAVVFEAGFSDQAGRHQQSGVIQHPVTETAVCYLLALAASATMLWFFQRWHSGDSLDWVLHQTIVLGVPAAVGGAAGRLAV